MLQILSQKVLKEIVKAKETVCFAKKITLWTCAKSFQKSHIRRKSHSSFQIICVMDVVLAPIIKLKIADIKSLAKCALDII